MLNSEIKILLIEDNPGDVRLVLEYLSEKNFRRENIISASSLQQAETIIAQKDFDIVLLDLNLPDSKREFTLKSALKFTKNIPIIILSGNNDGEAVVDSAKSGVQEYLVKEDLTGTLLEFCIKGAIIRADAELQLRNANKFKDDLFSVITHDLRSPFSALIGFTDLTLQELESLSKKEIQENVTYIKDISLTLLNFMENLLSWSTQQSDKFKIEAKKFYLKELLNRSLEVSMHTAKVKNIDIQFNELNGEAAFADIDMIDTVLRNLLNNAIKFSPDNSQINVNIKIKDKIVIEVVDNGIGITQEELNNIFDISKKRLKYGTRNEKGHGLGLLICKDFVEKNGGELSIESKAMSGTKVSFTVPVAE